MWLKQNLFKKSSRTLLLAICYSSMQSYFKIDLDLTMFLMFLIEMFIFYIENDEPFGPLTKNCPNLDKNKSTVSRFSVSVVYKSAISTVEKSNIKDVSILISECLYLHIYFTHLFVFRHLFPDISANCIFTAGKKISTTILLFS